MITSYFYYKERYILLGLSLYFEYHVYLTLFEKSLLPFIKMMIIASIISIIIIIINDGEDIYESNTK